MAFQRRTFKGISELLNSINTKIQNALLPSGAIVWFKRQTAPVGWVICDGTNGTPNLIDKYPLGATSDIGSTVEPGLPNITGQVGRGGYSYKVQSFEGVTEFKGAFKSSTTMTYQHTGDYSGTVKGLDTLIFSAQDSNSIYGNSTTVTPPSVKLLPCMKL